MRATALGLLALGLAACRTPSPVEAALAPHEAALRQAREVESGLALRCEPPEAEVLIDGVLQGSCADFAGRTLSLSEGAHRVDVTRAGFRPYQAQVAPGRARTGLQVQLVPAN